MSFLNDDLITLLRREHHCPSCSGRNESAGTTDGREPSGGAPVVGPAQAAPDPTTEPDPED